MNREKIFFCVFACFVAIFLSAKNSLALSSRRDLWLYHLEIWQLAPPLQIQRSPDQYKIFLPIIIKPPDRFYAFVQRNGGFYGVWATIETANPAIREEQFSYTSINIVNYDLKWVETGWIKAAQTGCVPKFIWAIQPGTPNVIESPVPTIGVAYQYQITKLSDGNWRLKIMETNGKVLITKDISNPGLNWGASIQAAGEVFSLTAQNDMGVAGILSMKWMSENKQWYYWEGWHTKVEDKPYKVIGISPNPNNNVQISGNNGKPLPSDAPCP